MEISKLNGICPWTETQSNSDHAGSPWEIQFSNGKKKKLKQKNWSRPLRLIDTYIALSFHFLWNRARNPPSDISHCTPIHVKHNIIFFIQFSLPECAVCCIVRLSILQIVLRIKWLCQYARHATILIFQFISRSRTI